MHLILVSHAWKKICCQADRLTKAQFQGHGHHYEDGCLPTPHCHLLTGAWHFCTWHRAVSWSPHALHLPLPYETWDSKSSKSYLWIFSICIYIYMHVNLPAIKRVDLKFWKGSFAQLFLLENVTWNTSPLKVLKLNAFLSLPNHIYGYLPNSAFVDQETKNPWRNSHGTDEKYLPTAPWKKYGEAEKWAT